MNFKNGPTLSDAERKLVADEIAAELRGVTDPYERSMLILKRCMKTSRESRELLRKCDIRLKIESVVLTALVITIALMAWYK